MISDCTSPSTAGNAAGLRRFGVLAARLLAGLALRLALGILGLVLLLLDLGLGLRDHVAKRHRVWARAAPRSTPATRVADYGLEADLFSAVPELVAAL